jgi:hypothetical protein
MEEQSEVRLGDALESNEELMSAVTDEDIGEDVVAVQPRTPS